MLWRVNEIHAFSGATTIDRPDFWFLSAYKRLQWFSLILPQYCTCTHNWSPEKVGCNRPGRFWISDLAISRLQVCDSPNCLTPVSPDQYGDLLRAFLHPPPTGPDTRHRPNLANNYAKYDITCHQFQLSCSILIGNRSVVSPTLNVKLTVFVSPCKKNLGIIDLQLLQVLSLTKRFFIQMSVIHDNISSRICLDANYIKLLFQELAFGWTETKLGWQYL